MQTLCLSELLEMACQLPYDFFSKEENFKFFYGFYTKYFEIQDFTETNQMFKCYISTIFVVVSWKDILGEQFYFEAE